MKKVLYIAIVLMMAAGFTACDQESGYPYRTHYLPVQLAGSQKWSIMDVETGEIIARDAYAQAPSAVVADMFYVMNENGTYDFYNVADPKKPVNKQSYGSVTSFSDDGLAVVSLRGEPLTVINTRCEVVKELPRNVAQCSMFNHGRAAYQTDDGLWGYINERGDTVISARYASANAFLHSNYAIVTEPAQANDSTLSFIVINKDGKELFHANTQEYGIIQPFFVSGVLPVVKNDSIVCLDENGKEVPNPNDYHQAVDKAGYKDFSRTSAGLFMVVKDGKMGLVDQNNQVLIPAKWDRLADISADRYIAVTDTVCQLVDRQGNVVGKEKFIHVHGSIEATQAARGFIDTALAAASLLMLLGPDQCCGATPATTLMDMNRLLGDDPNVYNGQNALVVPQGPFRVEYLFNNYIASAPSAEVMPSFNLDARVMAVNVGLNVAHCGLKTEQDVVDKIASALGTRGFVLEGNDIFTSEAGPAISMGYAQGIVTLFYFMNRSFAQPLPRIPRK